MVLHVLFSGGVPHSAQKIPGCTRLASQVATCTLLLTLATGPSRRGPPRRCLGLASPKALQPAAPEGASSGQVELPDFWQYAATLEEVPGPTCVSYRMPLVILIEGMFLGNSM